MDRHTADTPQHDAGVRAKALNMTIPSPMGRRNAEVRADDTVELPEFRQ